MKLRLELDDGRVFEGEGQSRTIACLVDRVAFERRFQTSATVLSQWQHLFGEDGEPREDADTSGIREEWITFILWCELRRRASDVPDFDEVIEHALELSVDADDAADPTPAP